MKIIFMGKHHELEREAHPGSRGKCWNWAGGCPVRPENRARKFSLYRAERSNLIEL